MEYPDDSGERPPPRRDLQKQKSPPPLKVNRGSHKIRKPPFPPPPPPPPPSFRPPPPVIIYEVSPVVHHINPGEFREVVQRLTGPPQQPPPPPPPAPPMFEMTRMPLGDYNSNMSGYGASSSRPGPVLQEGGFQPGSDGPGPSVFDLPVPSPLIIREPYQQQYADYNSDYMTSSTVAPNSTSTNAFPSHGGQLTSSNSSNDLMNTLNIYFPQQEDDRDHRLFHDHDQ